jgi:hypothetical protein
LQKILDDIDPVLREGLSDENIRYPMATFLNAASLEKRRGHTAGDLAGDFDSRRVWKKLGTPNQEKERHEMGEKSIL